MSRYDLRAQANAHYGINKAALRVGIDMGDYFRARKVYCPFGAVFHSDGGDEPAMRVYEEDGHAYCFACARRFSPSQLIAAAEDITEDAAVESMLIEIGYIKSDNNERWEAAQKPPTVDRGALAEALHIAASHIIAPWSIRQYDADVIALMRKCLTLLDKVETIEQGDTWLDTVKKVLVTKFGKEEQ